MLDQTAHALIRNGRLESARTKPISPALRCANEPNPAELAEHPWEVRWKTDKTNPGLPNWQIRGVDFRPVS